MLEGLTIFNLHWMSTKLFTTIQNSCLLTDSNSGSNILSSRTKSSHRTNGSTLATNCHNLSRIKLKSRTQVLHPKSSMPTSMSSQVLNSFKKRQTPAVCWLVGRRRHLLLFKMIFDQHLREESLRIPEHSLLE